MQNEGSVVTSDERGSSTSIAQHSPLFRTHLDAEWVCGWSIPLSDMPLFVNQELGEVPLCFHRRDRFCWISETCRWAQHLRRWHQPYGENKGNALKLSNLILHDQSLFISAWTCKRVEIEEVLCAQIHLVKNRILSREASANKLDDLLTRARLLPTELVAWERKDLKTWWRSHQLLAAIFIAYYEQ